MLLKAKSVGDSLYVVFNDSLIHPRTEAVEFVGRGFIRTVQGNQYSIADGVERKQCKRRDWVATCRAYPSYEYYQDVLKHNIRFYRLRRTLENMSPADFTTYELLTLEALVTKAKE